MKCQLIKSVIIVQEVEDGAGGLPYTPHLHVASRASTDYTQQPMCHYIPWTKPAGSPCWNYYTSHRSPQMHTIAYMSDYHACKVGFYHSPATRD
jgi:hypothetical protein